MPTRLDAGDLIETIPRAEIEFTTAQTRTARTANIKAA
jgi:hypothetical protein